MSIDSDQLTDGFGRIIASEFDRVVKLLQANMGHSDTEKRDSYFRSIVGPDRELEIAQYAIESFIHNLMSAFEESNTYKICAMVGDGSFVDISNLVEEGMHSRQFEWLEHYSENSLVSEKIYLYNRKIETDR